MKGDNIQLLQTNNSKDALFNISKLEEKKMNFIYLKTNHLFMIMSSYPGTTCQLYYMVHMSFIFPSK